MEMLVMKRLKGNATTTLRISKQWDALQLERVDLTMPLPRFRKLQVDAVTKGQLAEIYIQLRTDHAPLNRHLHHTKSIDSSVCTIGNRAHETVKHFLLNCPKTSKLRATRGIHRQARTIRTHFQNDGTTDKAGEEKGDSERRADSMRDTWKAMKHASKRRTETQAAGHTCPAFALQAERGNTQNDSHRSQGQQTRSRTNQNQLNTPAHEFAVAPHYGHPSMALKDKYGI